MTNDEIARGDYKKYFGGGAANWESRGSFQLAFLKEIGLTASSRVLDVGCGPLRAGTHLIAFLDEGNYYGVDYNRDFIAAARRIVETKRLSVKRPTLEVVEAFAFERIVKRQLFFGNIGRSVRSGGKVYISHAKWFNRDYLANNGMIVTKQFEPQEFDIVKYGWTNADEIFPIIELTVA